MWPPGVGAALTATTASTIAAKKEVRILVKRMREGEVGWLVKRKVGRLNGDAKSRNSLRLEDSYLQVFYNCETNDP